MSFSDYKEWLKLTSPPHCRENKIAAFRYMAPTHLVKYHSRTSDSGTLHNSTSFLSLF